MRRLPDPTPSKARQSDHALRTSNIFHCEEAQKTKSYGIFDDMTPIVTQLVTQSPSFLGAGLFVLFGSRKPKLYEKWRIPVEKAVCECALMPPRHLAAEAFDLFPWFHIVRVQ